MDNLQDYMPAIEWDARMRRYTVSAILATGREELVFANRKSATDYRNQYLADIQMLLSGGNPVFNSGAVL